MEGAALGQRIGIGHRAANGFQPPPLASRLSQARNGAQQRLGVGMHRVVENRVDVCLLDDLAHVHHDHIFRHLRHDAQVVGDVHDRHPQFALQVAHEPQDLGLGGHIERRRRLVGNEQAGVTGECHRDHRALAQASRQLMWIGIHALLGLRETDEIEHLDRFGPRFGLAHFLVQRDRFHDLVADGVDGAERGHRLLRHERNFRAANVAHFFTGLAEARQFDFVDNRTVV